MSAKLLATQIAGVTMGVIGTALIFNAVDKATRQNHYRRVVLFDKLHRIRGDIKDHGFEVDITPVSNPVYLSPYRSIVFDDFSSDPIYYYD